MGDINTVSESTLSSVVRSFKLKSLAKERPIYKILKNYSCILFMCGNNLWKYALTCVYFYLKLCEYLRHAFLSFLILSITLTNHKGVNHLQVQWKK